MTRLTKNDMARVIVAALYNMRALPPTDHHEVIRWERKKADELRDHHKRALAAIASVRRDYA
jgi:hypothetical protein